MSRTLLTSFLTLLFLSACDITPLVLVSVCRAPMCFVSLRCVCRVIVSVSLMERHRWRSAKEEDSACLFLRLCSFWVSFPRGTPRECGMGVWCGGCWVARRGGCAVFHEDSICGVGACMFQCASNAGPGWRCGECLWMYSAELFKLLLEHLFT